MPHPTTTTSGPALRPELRALLDRAEAAGREAGLLLAANARSRRDAWGQIDQRFDLVRLPPGRLGASHPPRP